MTDRNDNDPFAGIEPYRELTGLTGDEPILPLEDPRTPQATAPRSPLLTGLVLGLLLVVVSIALFQLLGGDDGGTVAAPDTTAATEATDATTGDGGSDATVDEGTVADDTTTPTGTATPYLPVGPPIAIEDLPLSVDGVGDITFGQPADDAIGRLISSLGEPESDTGPVLSVGEWGICPGDTERVIMWPPFAAVVHVDPDGTETFAGYRLDLAFQGFANEAANLATLSGLTAGASYRSLEQIYDGFDVRKADDDELGPIWQLYSANTGALLLWGPLNDDDVVRGIYSVDACGRF